MKTYTCSKIVKAKPMNRADYNTLRGWILPDDECGDDDGYLVEYIDGGKPNHHEFSGYISWSPKEQFDAAYIEVGLTEGEPAYISRVKAERAKLESDIGKLENFIQSNPYFKMATDKERELLHIQHKAMSEYLSVIKQRLSAF